MLFLVNIWLAQEKEKKKGQRIPTINFVFSTKI
jgi:hypothetical protein